MKRTICLLFLLLIIPAVASARSGCCSHHGGVCGCGCCDGSGLSATCAPYYPECGSSEEPESSTAEDNSWIWWVIGIGGVGGAVYLFDKYKK